MINKEILFDCIEEELRQKFDEAIKKNKLKLKSEFKVILTPTIIECSKEDNTIGSMEYSNIIRIYNKKMKSLFLDFELNKGNKMKNLLKDIEELDEKEKVQMKHLGWKSGFLFGFFMWLSGPLVLDLDYPNGLIAPKVLFFGLMCGLTFGPLMQLVAKMRQK